MNGIVSTDITDKNIVVCKNVNPLPGNEVAPPLTLDQEYPVKEVRTCDCGQKHIDVGLVSQYNYVRCYNCESQLDDGDSKHWCHPNRFEIKS